MIYPHTTWQDRLVLCKERLRRSPKWFPYITYLSFFLIFLLLAYVSIGSNQRLGHPSEPMVYGGNQEKVGTIWLGITTDGDHVIITTSDRTVFKWPVGFKDLSVLEPFINHLKSEVSNGIYTAALRGEVLQKEMRAIISADRHLSYKHFTPILHAMAQARIHSYGFEALALSDTQLDTKIKEADDTEMPERQP